MILLKLFLIFFRIGLFTIGGGLASIPFLKEYIADAGFISQTEFIDMIAISQSTPGPIGINMATYAGFKIASVPGSITATAGIVAPSLIIIILIAAFMKNFADLPSVKNTLNGIRPAAVGLIGAAAWFILSSVIFLQTPNLEISSPNFLNKLTASIDTGSLLLFAALAAAYRFKPAAPVFYILTGGILGIVFL